MLHTLRLSEAEAPPAPQCWGEKHPWFFMILRVRLQHSLETQALTRISLVNYIIMGCFSPQQWGAGGAIFTRIHL
jgi:hypothetical protein